MGNSKINKNIKRIIFSSYDDIANPYYGGGGAIAIHELAKRLVKDYKITVISWNHSGFKYEEINGVEYRRIGWKSINPKIAMFIYQVILPFVCVLENFDIWFENFSPPFTTSFLPIFTRKKVVGIVHMLSAGDMTRKYNLPIFTPIEKVGLKFYKKIIVTSENYKNKILNEIEDAHVEVIPNGIEKISFSKSKKVDQVLYLGRLETNQKGIDLLIKIFSKVVTSSPKTKLIIAGSGIESEEKRVNYLVNKSKYKKNIKLIGKIRGTKKQHLLNTSKVMLITSRFETFSITALEAMAHGLPIVCFDIDGLSWIKKDCALKTQPFNINEFSRNILKILKTKKLSNNLSKNGRLYAKQMTWSVVSSKYKRYIKSL